MKRYTKVFDNIYGWFQIIDNVSLTIFFKKNRNTVTNIFVTNGVRQGGVLSPLLFNVYVNDLSTQLSQTGIGDSIDGKFVNHMIYADDLCVISLSSSGLQSLLNICTDYSELHDLTFNAKKSVSMFFRFSVNKQCGLADTFISGTMCEFANEVKYLGACHDQFLIKNNH